MIKRIEYEEFVKICSQDARSYEDSIPQLEAAGNLKVTNVTNRQEKSKKVSD